MTTPTVRALGALLSVLLLLGPAAAAAPAATDASPRAGTEDAAAARRAGWVRPVPGELVHPFAPPAQDWLPGHRGVDLAALRGEPVAAPGGGVVTFAGVVGGKPVVVVTHHGGLRSTLEPVEAVVPRGAVVAAGSVVGTLATAPGTADNPSHCAPRDCLHWGVRRGERYLDPMLLLGLADPIVLLPLS
ncbi:peptidoglycan DD-metalloendopeptidase family protein [Isoptericola variabilis]|uniref:Peptidase M23 n=1 Tax=Isoptericola variabilis (strain 225) TaxID=743718 RepID=F6FRW6_ISOV2|nr:peptidoglycan DD-metalloendopeptidase family protein [Isoptericola variabilis]AEG43967.1 Peptidase M23 [Isoptericola variabilis 225]TWH30562.1 Membrane proteins related to metalloendopeptidases [Isoptericola variabilis J7]